MSMLYEFSSRQHLFNWTTSEQLRPQLGLSQDAGFCPAASLPVAGAQNRLSEAAITAWQVGMDHRITTVHEATLQNEERTNNICEGWNNSFASMVGHAHPFLWTCWMLYR